MKENTIKENIITENHAYHGLEPRHLWHHFAELNRIPRPSGQEAAARAYVQQVAGIAGVSAEVDAAGNIVVRVPARGGGSADAPTVAVQAHVDMVCEKRPDVQHDFTCDPILPRRQEDCIYACGTTLGADNGIGAAAALAVLTEPGLRHGPLELIFTVEEETGLHGALALDPTLMRASRLVNLDSEDPNELTIGCAGGAGTVLQIPLSRETPAPAWLGCELVVSGLKGGHSGVQIHEPLANAIKLLVGALRDAQQAGVQFQLVSISGGSAHNAIPRDAVARLVVAPDAFGVMDKAVRLTRETLSAQWAGDEPHLSLELSRIELPEFVMIPTTQDALLSLLEALPHGVLVMSEAFPGKVQTSTNLASVQMWSDHIEVATSTRSFVADELQEVQERIQKLGDAAGAMIEVRDGYPGWEPDAGSRLLQVAAAAYEKIYGKPPQVEVIHAGLECGVIVAKKPGLEAISFGPLIRGAHTPEEHVVIATVGPTWNLLTTLLEALS